jgi:Malectin domain
VLIAGAGYTAVTKTATVLVQDGLLTVRLLDNVPGINYPLISGLEVRAVAPPTTPAPPMKAPVVTNAPMAAVPVKSPSAPIVAAPMTPIVPPMAVQAPLSAPMAIQAPQVAMPIAPPVLPPMALPVAPPVSAFSMLINCGGQAYTDTRGRVWMADAYSNGGNTYGTASDIAETLDDELYRTMRWGQISYDIPVPAAGTYEVTLHMAEI